MSLPGPKLAVFLVLCLMFFTYVNGACTTNPTSCTTTQCCEEDIPAVQGAGGTYYPKQNCYDNTNTINYNCTGDLIGPPFNQCNNGGWMFPDGPTCEVVPGCPQPTIPNNGDVDPNQTEYKLFTGITYTCNDGYTIVGPTEAVCESGGTWNPSTTPTCEANCPEPNIPNGGIVEDPPHQNGEVVTYICYDNYTLVGISTATCRDGTFDPPNVPTCYAKCNPPVVADSDYSEQRDHVDHSSTITIKCDAGYSTGTATTTPMTCTDGGFDVDPPECFQNCPSLSDTFDNGVRGGDSSPYYHDETVTYMCNSRYTLVGTNQITCDDGSWSDAEPLCKENCDVNSIPNSNFATGDEVDHNSTFYVTCNDGYSTGISNSTEMYCNDGILRPPDLPTCYADCTPPVVENSDYSTQQPSVMHNTTINIICEANYSTGPTSRVTYLTCSDGSWDNNDVTCYENCPIVDTPTNGSISSGDAPFYHKEVVGFKCNDDYTLVGVDEIICTNGNWSDNPPECKAKCKPPVIPYSNYNMSLSLADHAADITVTCDVGYSNGESVNTTSTCDDGAWEPDIPLCYADCVPPRVNNSNYEEQEDAVFHTIVIIITCDSGFSTGSSINTTLECSNGDFVDETPTCYENCAPPIVNNSNYNTLQTDVFYGQNITVTCNDGYSTGTSTSQTLMCLGGDWDLDPPTCYENCEPPVVPNSNYGTPSAEVFHSVLINITCDQSYSTGESVFTLLECNDGNFIEEEPVCYANCPDFDGPDDGSYTGDSPPFYHTESVNFTCDEGFTLEGDNAIECDNGSWSGDVPECKAKCSPPTIPYSNFNDTQPLVKHGTSVNLTCDNGYSTGISTGQMLTCDDGEFDPEPPACRADCVPPIVQNSDHADQRADIFHSHQINITCNSNYTVGDSTSYTTLTCNDGSFDEENVACYANCPDPGNPENGEYGAYVGEDFTHGTSVVYVCFDRYELEGPETITCFDGQWSDVMPNCTGLTNYELIMLTCGPTSMEVEIPKVLLDGIEHTDLGLEGNLSCAAYSDGDMMRVNTTLSGCGTNKTHNATHDTYTNRVVNNYYNDIITRVVDVQIPLKCVYARNQQVRAVRFAINDYTVGKDLQQTGTYKMAFSIYNSSNFLYSYGANAIDIAINQALYFQIDLVTDMNGNKIEAQDCWGTPSSSGLAESQYELLNDGCPVDESFKFIESDDQRVNIRFRLNSFRFVDDEDKQVFIHCEVLVCLTSSTESECNPNCSETSTSFRRKRAIEARLWHLDTDQTLRENAVDVNSRIKRAKQHGPIVKKVRAGPIRWTSRDKSHVDTNVQISQGERPGLSDDIYNTPQSSSPWMNSVIAMGAIVMVFAVTLVAVVRHYRQKLRKDYKYQPLDTYS